MTIATVPTRRTYKHAHLFAGLGGGAKGFNAATARYGSLEADFRCLGGIDVDPSAMRDFERLTGTKGTVMDLFDRQMYRSFHDREPPPDWREATPADVRAAFGNEDPDVVLLSAPCLPATGPIITKTGRREIQTTRVGDHVLTHRGRFRKVTHVGRHRYTGTMYGFRLNGSVDTEWFTDEHPLWMRRIVRPAPQKKRILDKERFAAAREVKVGDRIGFPIDTARVGAAATFISSLGNPRLATKGGTSDDGYEKSIHVATMTKVIDLSPSTHDDNLWYLLGCYLGDGYRRKKIDLKYEVMFCVGAHDSPLAKEVRKALQALGIGFSEDRNGGDNNIKIVARSKHLHMICGRFGDGAQNKAIPPELMQIEDHLLEPLIQGYRDTDGNDVPRRQMSRGNVLQGGWQIPSTSLQLLRDLQRLLLRQSVFGGIRKVWHGGPQTIEGRIVQTLPRWALHVRTDAVKRTSYEFMDGVVCVRVKKIEKRQTDEWVWNLSVDEDDTFCAPMMATHNCKSFSGLMSEGMSKTTKYQALNKLTIRGIWLTMEAYKDNPCPLLIFENVPKIMQRGRHLLDQIGSILRDYGYAVAETTHDCGVIGGLAQSRKRFLLVARHMAKVPPFLYEPPKRALRGVGEVIGRLPMPQDEAAGPMHRMPSLQWQTWVRLACVRAGSDWRSLRDLAVEGGVLRDYMLLPDTDWHNGMLGVNRWDEHMGVVTAGARPTQGKFSVADPREATTPGFERAYRMVARTDDPQGNPMPDPRSREVMFHNSFKLIDWARHSQAVTGQHAPSNGALCIADPRSTTSFEGKGKYQVTPWKAPTGTVIAASATGNGAFAVADGRATTTAAQADAAGPATLPAPTDRGIAHIRAIDDTWHRPLTTLELACLQSLVEPEEHLELEGMSDTAWRERVGNAIPAAAAQAIAETMGRTLLMADAGETFMLSSVPIWVRPLAIALSVAQPEEAATHG